MHTAAVHLVTNPCTTILHGTFHAPHVAGINYTSKLLYVVLFFKS